jgi:hypothetical protein
LEGDTSTGTTVIKVTPLNNPHRYWQISIKKINVTADCGKKKVPTAADCKFTVDYYLSPSLSANNGKGPLWKIQKKSINFPASKHSCFMSSVICYKKQILFRQCMKIFFIACPSMPLNFPLRVPTIT